MKGLKQGGALSPLLFNFPLDFAIRWVQVNKESLKSNDKHQLLAYADDVNILKENAESLVAATRETGLEVSVDKSKYIFKSRDQNPGQNHSVRIDNITFERVEDFKYLERTLAIQNSIREEKKFRLKSGNSCYHSVCLQACYPRLFRIKIYRNILLLVVLYGCEAWSLKLREERKLRVFENIVLRRILGPRRDEVTEECRRLHNEVLSEMYPSPNILRLIKSRRMKWVGHLTRRGWEMGAYRFFLWNPDVKRPLGRPRRRCVNNIRMDLLDVGCGYMDWILLAQVRDRWRTLVGTVMNIRVP